MLSIFGMSPRQFGKLVTALQRQGVDPVRQGRPWSLPLEDRVLLVAAYWRTNLPLRQLAPLHRYSTLPGQEVSRRESAAVSG